MKLQELKEQIEKLQKDDILEISGIIEEKLDEVQAEELKEFEKTIIDKLVTSPDDDNLLDDFVATYDNDSWCRGYFKTMISELIKKAKKNGTQTH